MDHICRILNYLQRQNRVTSNRGHARLPRDDINHGNDTLNTRLSHFYMIAIRKIFSRQVPFNGFEAADVREAVVSGGRPKVIHLSVKG